MASNNMIKAVRLMVETSLTQNEIADIVGVRYETVSKYKKHPEYEEVKLQAERDFLGDLVSPALKTMRELLKADSENVQFSTAKDILDRTGHKPIDKQETTLTGELNQNHNMDNLTEEELRKLAKLGDD